METSTGVPDETIVRGFVFSLVKREKKKFPECLLPRLFVSTTNLDYSTDDLTKLNETVSEKLEPPFVLVKQTKTNRDRKDNFWN